MVVRILYVFFFCLLAGSVCHAQVDPDEGSDSASTNSLLLNRESKSPTTAILCGLIPTGGQLYTEQFWKIPLFLLPIGGLVGVGLYNQGLADDEEALRVTADPSTDAYSRHVSLREQYRDRRDLSYGVAGGIYLLSLVDAYVGAHLFSFDVSDSLVAIRISPDVERNGVMVALTW